MKQLLISLLELQKEKSISRKTKKYLQDKIHAVNEITDESKIFLQYLNTEYLTNFL